MKLFVLGSICISVCMCVLFRSISCYGFGEIYLFYRSYFIFYFIQIKSKFSMWLWFYDRFRYDALGIVCKFLKPLLIIMFYISFVRFVILWSSILRSSYLKLRYFFFSPLNSLQRITCRHIDRFDAIKEIK